MAITLAVGTIAAIASAYAASSAVSAATNDTEAVITVAASHGIVVGDFVEFTTGWDFANGRIFRVKTVATNDVTLEGFDTSDTDRYPAGSGTGSVRRITGWTNISQITAGIGVSGGDQNFADITTLIDRTQKQIPTTRSPIVVTLPVFDDPSLAWYAPVQAAAQTAVATGLRLVYPNGSRLVASAYWSLQEVPTIEDSTLRSNITCSFSADPTRYAS